MGESRIKKSARLIICYSGYDRYLVYAPGELHDQSSAHAGASAAASTHEAVLTMPLPSCCSSAAIAKMTGRHAAARAGVSRGAQSHYFRTKLDLTIAAAKCVMASALQLAESMAETAIRSGRYAGGAFIAQSRQFFLEPSYVAMIEILLVARTDLPLSKDFSELIITTRRKARRYLSCRCSRTPICRTSSS